jgi:hypothetical protein
MNVSLSFNNIFKWRGLVNIKWDSPFGYLNHALTLKKMDLQFSYSITYGNMIYLQNWVL